MVIGRKSIVAAGQMQAAFLVQIAYAIFTWLIAGLVIKYQGYDLVDNGIKLKGGLIDYFIFFLVFLFGVRSLDDGMTVIKWILFGAVFANLATILDTVGETPLVRLSRIGAGLAPQIVAKLESFNPGGSIKDRVAVRLVEAAERDGRLRPGATLVETWQ